MKCLYVLDIIMSVAYLADCDDERLKVSINAKCVKVCSI